MQVGYQADMTTVTVAWMQTVVKKDYQGVSELRRTTDDAVANAQAVIGTPLTVSKVVYSEDQSPVNDWQHSSQRTGSQPLTIVVGHSQTLVSQMQDLFKRAEATEATLAVISRPRVSNIAAQILLVAAGKADLRESTCDWFSQLGSANAAIVKLSYDMSIRAEKLVAEADRIITRRNSSIHFNSVASLDAEVEEVSKLISPALEKVCYWECWVVTRYTAIKQAFGF